MTSLRLASLLLGTVLLTAPAAAQVTGISYTFSPTAQRVLFDGDAALSDGYLYGGTLGFGFGEYVELSGLYQLGSSLETEFGDLDGLEASQQQRLEDLLFSRDVEMQRYGGELKFNLATGATIPYLTLGTGILRLEPDGLDATRTVYLSAGAGVQLSQSGRYTIQAGVENLAYRYDLATALLSEDDRATVGLQSYEEFVRNWTVRAGVSVYLGGRARGELTDLDRALRDQLAGGLRGAGLVVEPFYGRINFDEGFRLREDQRMTGLSAGVDLGPYVGLRGFYWRGLEEDELTFDDLQAYGGEMKLTFGSEVQGITPYLTLGAGWLDPLSGYEGPEGEAPPEEHLFALGGGGLVVPIGSTFRLHGQARSLLMSDEDADELETTGDVKANWMYSLGLTFTFGRRAETTGRLVESRFEETRAGIEETRAEARAREERLAEQLARSEQRLDVLADALRRAQRGDSLALTEALVRLEVDRERPLDALTTPASRRAETPATTAATETADAQDPRTVTLPVLENGEIYVRFGEGRSTLAPFRPDTAAARPAPSPRGDLTAEQIERIVRETVQDQLAGADGRDRVETQQQLRQQQIVERLEDQIRTLEARIETLRDREAATARRVLVPGEDDDVTVAVTDEVDPLADPVDRRLAAMPQGSVLLAGLLPFSALTFGDPSQFALGARADFRSSAFAPVRVVPEFAVGLGLGNYSYHLNANGIYPLPAQIPFLDDVFPYVGAGLGFLGIDDPPEDVPGVQLTINVLLGGEIVTENGIFFAEYGIFDFFDYNRLAVGYRYGF